MPSIDIARNSAFSHTMSTGTDETLNRKIRGLAQEIQDSILEFVQELPTTVLLTTGYKPPAVLQLNYELRVKLLPRYYRGTTFEVTAVSIKDKQSSASDGFLNSDQTISKWALSLTKANQRMIDNIQVSMGPSIYIPDYARYAPVTAGFRCEIGRVVRRELEGHIADGSLRHVKLLFSFGGGAQKGELPAEVFTVGYANGQVTVRRMPGGEVVPRW